MNLKIGQIAVMDLLVGNFEKIQRQEELACLF